MSGHHPSLNERQKRQVVMRQFELQFERFPVLELRERLTNYRYRFTLHDHVREVDVVAIVLVESFDFFRFRLNLLRQGVGMIVCQRHNGCVPLWVLDLSTAEMSRPATIPERIERPVAERKKRTSEEVNLFVSELVTGIDTAYQELATMPKRTQQWYLQQRDCYLHPRQGRPWAS